MIGYKDYMVLMEYYLSHKKEQRWSQLGSYVDGFQKSSKQSEASQRETNIIH